MSTALTLHIDGDALSRARAWGSLPDDERRRRAVEACQGHDAAALNMLTDAYLTLHGKAGARVSPHTRDNYRHGINALLTAWLEQNLLHPRRDAAVFWLREMEDIGLKPSTVRVRLAAASGTRPGRVFCTKRDCSRRRHAI